MPKRNDHKETDKILKRINDLNDRIGKPRVKRLEHYILHRVRDEILNEMKSTGGISPELAQSLERVPPKNIFLSTALERQGIPELFSPLQNFW